MAGTLSAFAFATVSTLPSAASAPNCVLVQGGKLWFSDGSAWVDLGTAGGGGGAVDYTVVTAGQTLADDAPLLAVITTPQTFTVPASPTIGDEYVVRNNSTSTAIASIDPGAGRQIVYGAGSSLPVADTLTIAPGEQAALIVRTATSFELNTPGAVGPAGPAAPAVVGGALTLNITNQSGVLEHLQAFTVSGVTASQRIDVRLTGAADSEENDPELLDVATLWATPATDQITVGITFSAPVSGPILVNWSAV